MSELVQDKLVEELNKSVQFLKAKFVGKDDIIDLMAICLVARENLFLYGPPGTAKSAMVNEMAKLLNGKNFEYLLTRFTEPNELFGPFDIRKLREGDLVTNTQGMLPEANLIFLDELLNANSAILNSLLMVLNEKVFKRGHEKKKLPVALIVGASNHLPEDEALQALFDRFLLRAYCDNIDVDLLDQVLDAGWKMEDKNAAQEVPSLELEDVFELQSKITQIDLSKIRPTYLELIRKLRNAGIAISDRRAVKLQRLIAASAIICKREFAVSSDLWVLRYIWDNLDQVEILEGMISDVISTEEEALHHPQSDKNFLPNPEEIYGEVEALKLKWDTPDLPASEKVLVKDKLRYLNGRSEWITDTTQREYVQKPINELWEQIIQTS